MKSLYFLVMVLFLAVFADAQTETVVNPGGATVVEVITQNGAGLPTTRILQTIVGSITSQPLTTSTGLTTTNPLLQTSLTLTTSTTQQIGPVGQPATEPATPGGPTPYEYTSFDANGKAVVQQGIFTPTGPQSVLPPLTTTGTVLDYSQWLSMIGTNTQPASAARRVSMSVATGWYYFAATAFAGLVGGAWLIIL